MTCSSQSKKKHSTTDELKIRLFFVMLLIYYSYHESNSHTIMTTDEIDFSFQLLETP